MKNFGDGICRATAPQNSVGLAAVRIGFIAVGEWKIVGRKKVLFVLAVGARWGREAVVERAEPTARDVRDDAVEHASALLVGVKALPQEMAEAAAALRRAKRESAVYQRLSVVAQQRVVIAFCVFERGNDVADPRQTRSLHDRRFGFVNDFINPA